MWDAIVGGLISSGIMLSLVTALAWMTWGRITDRFENHSDCIDELLKRTKRCENAISFMEGKASVGK